MATRRASLRHPYSLMIEIGWPDGTVSRFEVTRYGDRERAIRDARRVTTVWSQLLGGQHWPPTYLVVDARDGTEFHVRTSIERKASDGTEEGNTSPGRLF